MELMGGSIAGTEGEGYGDQLFYPQDGCRAAGAECMGGKPIYLRHWVGNLVAYIGQGVRVRVAGKTAAAGAQPAWSDPIIWRSPTKQRGGSQPDWQPACSQFAPWSWCTEMHDAGQCGVLVATLRSQRRSRCLPQHLETGCLRQSEPWLFEMVEPRPGLSSSQLDSVCSRSAVGRDWRMWRPFGN